MLNPTGLCMCGCGQKAPIATESSKREGYVKGQPIKYIYAHRNRLKKERGTSWKGGKTICLGYTMLYQPGHPRAHNNYVREHILIAEKALGKYLPLSAVVHHVNGTKNSETLVVCQDQAYHALIHQRQIAHKACGHANWRKCRYCKKYDDPINMQTSSDGRRWHRDCRNIYDKHRRDIKKTKKIYQVSGE